MSLPENHFFEVEWQGRDTRQEQFESRRGIVLKWGAPYGATAITVVMRDNLQVCTVHAEELKVLGIVDVGGTPVRRAGPPGPPARQVNVGRRA